MNTTLDIKVPYVSRWHSNDDQLRTDFEANVTTFLTKHLSEDVISRLSFRWTDDFVILQDGGYSSSVKFRRAKKNNQFRLDATHIQAIKDHFANKDAAEAAQKERATLNQSLEEMVEPLTVQFGAENVSLELVTYRTPMPYIQITTGNYDIGTITTIKRDGTISASRARYGNAGDTIASCEEFIAKYRAPFAEAQVIAQRVKDALPAEFFIK